MLGLLEDTGVNPQDAFPLGAEVGFAVKTAAAKGADTAREALMQATNAAAASLERGPHGGAPPEWALPVVVVRGALFTLGYSARGRESLKEAPWCRLIWHGADAFDQPTLVDVVTRAHWRTYVKELRSTTNSIIQRIDAHRAAKLAAHNAAERAALAAKKPVG
jgi:hypothetical protein